MPRGAFKSVNNRSSVGYNILNNNNNPLSCLLDMKLMETKLHNRKKSISEVIDLNHVFNPNFNVRYNKLKQETPNIFSIYKGVFSNMYDSNHRNGNIIKLFKNQASINKDEGNYDTSGKEKKINKNIT